MLNRETANVGFLFSIAVSVLTVITFGIAINTPPISGSWCIDGCIEYPYLNIADRFPVDFWWMFPGMALQCLYIIWYSALHRAAPEGKRVYTTAGFAFALLSAGILFVTYFIQVSVIPQSIAAGETSGIPLLVQYNPHGLFIAMEEAGYILMSLAMLLLAPSFLARGRTRVEKAVGWIVIFGFILSMVSLAAVTARLGINREYLFEVIIISIDWLVLISVGILTAISFRHELDGDA